MAEEFEDQDLSGATFWGVNLSDATFRDVNLTNTTIKGAWLVNVDIDAMIDKVVINGVDVTAFVNEHDRWYPLRSLLRPPDAAGMRTTLTALDDVWAATVERARKLPEP